MVRRKKKFATRIFAVTVAAAMTFSNVPITGFGTVKVMAEEVTQTLGENLIKNGDFSEELTAWGDANKGNSTISFEEGKFVLTIHDGAAGDDWMPGIFQEGIEIKEGSKYQIDFDIISAIDRKITVGFDAPRCNMKDVTLIAGEEQHVSYETEVISAGEASGNQKFYFYLGAYKNGAETVSYPGANVITLDNVSIREVFTGTEEAPEDSNESGKEDEQVPVNLVNGTVYTTKAEMNKTTKDSNGVENSWALQWSDEFSTEEFSNGKLVAHQVDGKGSELENAAWSYMIGNGSNYSGAGWGNNETQYYTEDNTSVAEGDDIDGGALVITAQKDSTYGTKYTSTRLWTMDDAGATKPKEKLYTKEYGRVEARIKITPKEGEDPTGLWPAFWMMPADDVYGTWAASGEIDIMEARGSNQHSVDGTIHYGSQWPNNKSIGGHYSADDFSTAEWHTYAIEWMPGELRWYVDDICYYTTSEWYGTSDNNAANYTYPAPFNQEFYILLNVAVGGNYDAGALSDNLTEASMYVDYVRSYDLIKEDGTVYTKADYDAIEKTVVAPEYVPADTPIGCVVGESIVDVSDLCEYKTTTNYPSEDATVRNNQWYVSNLGTGSGKSTNTVTEDDGDKILNINTTTVGTNDYDVQLIHNVPLTRGYNYTISFDAKADTAKTIVGKFANIAGYPAYSDGLSLDLESDWKHFSFSFDMMADDDGDGRIEFTLGGTTGTTSFKNFEIICNGKTKLAGADEEKKPLANGNHVYNGTFDQGPNSTYFWHASEGATFTSEKNVYKAVVTGTSADAGIYQKGLNLLASDTYRVKMDMSAETAADVKVLLTNADGTKVYASKTFAVATETVNNTFDFTMPEDVTDTNATLVINTGENKVVIDEVEMKRLTNNNLDWSAVDLYPLYNGDFYSGESGWNIWSENAGWQTHTISENTGMDMEYNVGDGADFWCVGVQSSSVKMVAGVPYKITFDYTSTIDKNIKIETPDGTQKDYDFEQGNHQKTILFTPTVGVNGSISMYFGNAPTGGNQHFILHDVTVAVDEEQASIPDAYKLKKPGSITSEGSVKAGNDAVIKTNDATWAEKVTTVYINGTAYGKEFFSVSGSKIYIKTSVVPTEGTYAIKFDAEGYAQTKAISQKVLDRSGNVLINGDFSNALEAWTTWFADWNVVNGSAVATEGMADIHIVSTEHNSWDAQLKQDGLKLETSDYYLLTFDAYATIERPIQMEFANLGTPSETIVNLTTEMKNYSISFTNVNTTTAGSILFMMGNVNGCLTDFAAVGEHHIFIDNVKLYKADKSEIDNTFAPAVTQEQQAILGKELVLGYTKNDKWAADVIVAVDGVTVDASKVMVDNGNCKVKLMDVFGSVGRHVITLSSMGYEDVVVTVNVLKSAGATLLSEEWFTWKDDIEQGEFKVEKNSITCHFVETVHSEWDTPEFWSMQAKKENIFTENAKEYILSFDTNLTFADEESTTSQNRAAGRTRSIVIETTEGQQEIEIEAGEGHKEITYTPGARNDFYVLIMLGGTEFGVSEHDIVLSNIKLTEKGTVDEPENGNEESGNSNDESNNNEKSENEESDKIEGGVANEGTNENDVADNTAGNGNKPSNNKPAGNVILSQDSILSNLGATDKKTENVAEQIQSVLKIENTSNKNIEDDSLESNEEAEEIEKADAQTEVQEVEEVEDGMSDEQSIVEEDVPLDSLAETEIVNNNTSKIVIGVIIGLAVLSGAFAGCLLIFKKRK